ncbi:MAG: hypothetical protein Kow0077_05680 [Anaerolineae bacterium]
MAITLPEFGGLLVHVLGQMMTAAGYTLLESPVQQAGGLFRFTRALPDGTRLTVDFQVLVYQDAPDRFQPVLSRVVAGAGRDAGSHAERITLPRLVVDVFGVRVLPHADHWWPFQDVSTAGEGLLEAGKLLVAYGLPWLEGTLQPPGG